MSSRYLQPRTLNPAGAAQTLGLLIACLQLASFDCSSLPFVWFPASSQPDCLLVVMHAVVFGAQCAGVLASLNSFLQLLHSISHPNQSATTTCQLEAMNDLPEVPPPHPLWYRGVPNVPPGPIKNPYFASARSADWCEAHLKLIALGPLSHMLCSNLVNNTRLKRDSITITNKDQLQLSIISNITDTAWKHHAATPGARCTVRIHSC